MTKNINNLTEDHHLPDYDMETLAVRAGISRSGFNEHSEAMFLTSSFVFANAQEAADRFAGAPGGYIYSRVSNPTVAMFEERLAALEGAERCLATASGMSAILATLMGLLSAGDHVVASRSLFGSTMQLFTNVIARFGVTVSFVSAVEVAQWQAAIQPNTRLFFVESPSNPLTEISDIARLSALAHGANIRLVVDNSFCSPALQRPLKLGADIVVHSATKYLDGQGRVLGGAVLGNAKLLDPIHNFLRTAGPTLSPFNAWVLLKGMETLALRMAAHSANALALAEWLASHPMIERVWYPGLASHPQHELAVRQQSAGGAIIAFAVRGGREAAWRVIDATRLISITANLGDTKTTITHPATTTHGRLSPEQRAEAGVGEGLLRLAVGLESVRDIRQDLERGLNPG
jgi:O-succinylhomoserine sulfhydrylase